MGITDNVVKSLLEKVLSLAADEVKLQWGLQEQMESLQRELEFIDIFLKSSVGKRNDDIVKLVVNQIRDVAYKAEDVVDIYFDKDSERGCGCMLDYLCFICHIIKLHGVGVEIGKIKRKIDEIYKNKEKYKIGEGDFKSEGVEVSQSLRKRRRNVDEEDVVHDSTVVIKELEKTCPRRTVVSINGMGGLGKTTLAKKIYNTNGIKKRFRCRAWGYVSNDYRPKELLLAILMCVGDSSQHQGLSEEELKQKVLECLKGKKYLIVLDDIWETKVWDEVQDAFPDGSGGKILITSRNMDVASHTRAALAYELPFLNQKDSWKLFSRMVFQEEECPSDLMEVGKSMVEGCGGLPLAIIVLAGIARKKKLESEWLTIQKHVNWHLAKETRVKDILKLSYDNLPQKLKPCFLYFAMYPEDHEIRVKELIQLWIAEGFIQETGLLNPPKLDVVARKDLDELVDLSLVQVARRRMSDGSVKTCRIHDLLRDLCISESRDEKFLDVCKSASSNPRRMSCWCIKESCIITSNNKRYQSCIRSLICFGKRNDDNQKHTMVSFVERFKLARVLDFGNIIYMVPNGLKTLIHLRYLRITVGSGFTDEGRDKDILACIFCLCNLEVLEIKGMYRATIIPIGMWKLKRLRHLYVDAGIKLISDMSKPESEIMSNLQTLVRVKLDPQTPSILNNDRFPNLIKLSLSMGADSSDEESFQRLSHLSNLRSLEICKEVKLPSNYAFLSNLTKIKLVDLDRFIVPAMETFGKLNKLQALTIGRIYTPYSNEFDVNIAAGDFQNLKVFKIRLSKLANWILGEGAMPRLECVFINLCHRLKGLPQELWSLTNLQKVEILRPSAQIEESLKDGMVMKNGCKIIITE